MKNTFFLLLFFCAVAAHSQRFDWATSGGYVGINNSYNGATDIARDGQGNMYTMDSANGDQFCQGDTIEPYDSYTCFIYKFNQDGILQDVFRIGAVSGDYYVYNLETDNQGDLYILGQPNGATTLIVQGENVAVTANTNVLIKLSSEGVFQWKYQTTFASNWQCTMLQYSDNAIIVQSDELVITRLDLNGSVLGTLSAEAYIPGTAAMGFYAKGSDTFSNGDFLVAAMSYGDIVFDGDTLFHTGNVFLTAPILLMRFNSDMMLVWARYVSNVRNPDNKNLPINISPDDFIYGAAQVNYEMIIGTDTITNPNAVFTGIGTIYKLDADGQDVWAKALDESGKVWVWCMADTESDSEIMLGGGFDGGSWQYENVELEGQINGSPFVMRIDPDGVPLHAFTYVENMSQTDALCIEYLGEESWAVGGKLSALTSPIFSCQEIDPAKGFYLGEVSEQPAVVPVPSITADGTLLTATPDFDGIIKWYLNGNLLAGENEQSIIATQTGDYSVTYAYIDGCTDTVSSVVQNVVVIGLDEIKSRELQLYPNPTNGPVQIVSTQKIQSISVFDSMGKLVYHVANPDVNDPLELGDLSSGVYIVYVRTASSSMSQLLLRR